MCSSLFKALFRPAKHPPIQLAIDNEPEYDRLVGLYEKETLIIMKAQFYTMITLLLTSVLGFLLKLILR